MNDATFLTRVVLEDYKSIAACDVRLGALTFLVGPNGSGKSNFLDALRFVADALRDSLSQAFWQRGGTNAIFRRRANGLDLTLGLRLEFVLPSGRAGHYALQLGPIASAGYGVTREECSVEDGLKPGMPTYYRVHVDAGSGQEGIDISAGPAPARVRDRLYLVNASSLSEFRPVYDALSRMAFYNLNAERMREIRAPAPDDLLTRDGGNIAGVLRRIAERDPETKIRIEEYLAHITAGINRVDTTLVGSRELLQFWQRAADGEDDWLFDADSMSDGTLRALGILVALFQSRGDEAARPTLVGIEEPEMALHPAAAGVLLDALGDASYTTQVIVTSHSPDLLDPDDVKTETILAVTAEEGTTRIGPLDKVGRSVLRDRLFTAGDLLRMDQLKPDSEAANGAAGQDAHLFDAGPG